MNEKGRYYCNIELHHQSGEVLKKRGISKNEVEKYLSVFTKYGGAFSGNIDFDYND